MKQYAELKSYNKIAQQGAELQQQLLQINNEKAEQAGKAIANLNKISEALTALYTKDQLGEYPVFDQEDMSDLKALYEEALKDMDDATAEFGDGANQKIEEIKANLNADLAVFNSIKLNDNLSLPAHVFKRTGICKETETKPENINKRPRFFEYSKLYLNSEMTAEAVAQKYNSLTQEQLTIEYDQAIENQNANPQPEQENDIQLGEIKHDNDQTYYLEVNIPDQNNRKNFAGSKSSRNADKTRAFNTYRAQTAIEDKMMVRHYYYARITTQEHRLTVDIPDNLGEMVVEGQYSENQLKAIQTAAQKNIDKAIKRRAQLGMNKTPHASPEEEAAGEELNTMLYNDLTGNCTREEFRKAFKSFSLVSCYMSEKFYELYTENLKLLAPNEPYRQEKAMYLTLKRENTYTYLNGQINNFHSDFLTDLSTCTQDDKYGIGQKIFANLHFNKLTTFDVYLKNMGISDHEMKLYLEDEGIDRNANVFDTFKQKLQNELLQQNVAQNNNPDPNVAQNQNNVQLPEVSDQDVIAKIKNDYIKRFVTSVVNEAIYNPSTYFKDYYSENMTIAHYMDILSYNEAEKANFLNEYGCTADDKVKTVFQNRMNADEPWKAKRKQLKLDSGKNEQEAVLLTDKDLEFYIDDIIKQESDRFNFVRYVKKATLPIDNFLDTIGYNPQEKTAFYNKHHIQADTTVKDAMKSINSQPGHPQLTDKEAYEAAQKFMDDEIERLHARGRGPKVRSGIMADVKNDYIEKLELQSDKEHFRLGNKIADAVDVDIREEDAAKSEKYAHLWNWKNSTGDVIIRDKEIEDNENAFQFYSGKVFSSESMNIHNSEKLLKYHDSTIATDTTFLRGAISVLEETKQGHGFRHSENSTKYNNMLSALKTYERKMSACDTDGIEAAKNNLIEQCKNYVSGREGVRRRDFGNTRFEVVSTLLYQLMPRNEFQQWMDNVNLSREEDPLTFEICSIRTDRYISDQREQDDVVQNQCKQNRINIPSDYIPNLYAVESLYGMKPEYNAYTTNFKQEDFQNVFTAIPDEEIPAPVGPAYKTDKLPDKDFVAIAYAGALTPDIAKLDPRLPEYLDRKTLYTGKDYTSNLFMRPMPESCTEYKQCIQGGRNAARLALNEYSAGDKMPLAAILAAGIRHIAAQARNRDTIDDSFIVNGEMGRRMVDMLNRDKELMKLANLGGTEKLKNDIALISGIANVANIHIKCQAAKKSLNTWSKKTEDQQRALTTDMKRELITDIIFEKLINESITKKNHKRYEGTRYKTKVGKAKSDYDKAWAELSAKNDSGQISDEDFEKEMQKLDDRLGIEKAIASDTNRGETILTDLQNTKYAEALRENVKKLVKDSGLAKKSPREILNELNSQKILGKIATLAAKTNEKRDEEAAKRVQKSRENANAMGR